ncbi:hypothetical protein HCN44_003731 [Aphidius gifuensis]|uniref:tRNA-dihydrouridine(16/17) synthase [NAD(P)(+)] n=1 Tax=Aphidius gifuensis TaxID=684658 RepID=A0A834XIR1_APHGI|nr:hypothetical protein HCN44_003731 [Aphidius gifuensis]
MNEEHNENSGDNFWIKIGCPRHIVAPMVDASELAWRLLSRNHGGDLCYTPMFHSSVFCRDAKYRKDALQTNEQDRPLIVQFCGNDPDIILQAAKFAEPYCDAIDVNMGCPQGIAKRGHYGAFLQDDWELLKNIVVTLKKGLKIPVTCKLRVFPELNKTIEYAKMLENAGASLLTVHGRTREQKGPLTGLASWEHIKAVCDACIQDVDKCIEFTGVQGVMSAEGNLYNPFIFEGCYPPCWIPATEYLDLVDKYPAPASFVRGHLFKIFQHILSLPENSEEREILARNSTMESFRNVVDNLREQYLPDTDDYNLKLPPWLCQPYVRSTPEEHISKLESKKIESEKYGIKREYLDDDGNQVSKSKMKKLKKVAHKQRLGLPVKKGTDLCQNCPNPSGLKCEYKYCRQCCRNKCYSENLDCIGHRNMTKTRRKIAIDYKIKRNEINTT